MGDLSLVRESAGFVLGIDELAVQFHVEDTFTFGHKLCLNAEGGLQFRSQTGRVRFIVSLAAIANQDIHHVLPGFATSVSGGYGARHDPEWVSVVGRSIERLDIGNGPAPVHVGADQATAVCWRQDMEGVYGLRRE